MARAPSEEDLSVRLPGLDEKITELRELIREANGTLGDIRRERREAAIMMEKLGPDEVTRRIEEAVAAGLVSYDATLKVAIDEATQAVYDRFDLIAGICLGEDAISRKDGKPAIEELVRRYIARHGPVS